MDYAELVYAVYDMAQFAILLYMGGPLCIS